MQKFFFAALALILAAAPAAAQQAQYPLTGLFYADGAGAGIDVDGRTNGTPGLVGIVPPANLGTGTADDTTYLRGDGAWETPTGGGSAISVRDETTDLTDALEELTFTGAGVECTEPGTDNHVTCTITGGGGQALTAPFALASPPSNYAKAPPDRLGTGTPGASNFLRGDGTWAVPAGGGQALTTSILQLMAGTTAEMNPYAPAGTVVTVAHGLSRIPDFYRIYLEAIAVTDGYAIGDRIPSFHIPWSTTVRSDATNVYIIPSSRTQTVGIADVTSPHNDDNFTAASWKYVVIPYILEDTSIVGLQGDAGAAGQQGTAGTDGAIGPAGTAGPAGAAGATGQAGANGQDGTHGQDGQDGAAGSTGPIGPDGPAGAAGTDGATGPAGTVGATGPAGPAGDITGLIAPFALASPPANYAKAPPDRLGTGTPEATNFLRGDGSWAIPAGGGQALTTSIAQRTYGAILEVGTTANPWANDTSFTLAHGLSRVPDGHEVYLEFVTAVEGYEVGDRTHWAQLWTTTPWSNATIVGIRTRQNASPLAVVSRSRSAQVDLNRSNFKLVARPWIHDNVSIIGLQGDSGATGQQGVAGTDGTDGDDGADGTIVTANPDNATTPLTSIGLDGTNFLVSSIVQPNTSGQLRAAVEADIGRLARDHLNLRIGTRQSIGTTDRSVTTANYAAPGYHGTSTSCTTIAPSNVGDTCFSRIVHAWFIRQAGSGSWGTNGATPSGWIGTFLSQGEAHDAVTANSQIYYVQGSAFVTQVTAFAAATTVYDYHWEPEQERQALLTSRCPTPSTGIAGELCQVNSTGDAYGTVAVPILPAPANSNILQYARVNSGGTAYETAAIVLPDAPEEIYAVPPVNVTQVGNAITLVDVPTLTNGLILHFQPKGTNTGAVLITIGSDTYSVFKAGEDPGTFEAFEGGEWHNALPVQVAYDGGFLYWFGAVLGGAATRDVGTLPNELVAVGSDGNLPGATDPSVLHLDTSGFPQVDPLFAGHLAANDEGDLYVARDVLVDHAVDPSWNTALLSTIPVGDTWGRYLGVDPTSQPTARGQFYFDTGISRWQLQEDPNPPSDGVRARFWSFVLSFFRSNATFLVGAPAGLLPTAVPDSHFMASSQIAFTTDAEAAIAAHGVTSAATTAIFYYEGNPNDPADWRLRIAQRGAWIAGTTTTVSELHWSGPVGAGASIPIPAVSDGFSALRYNSDTDAISWRNGIYRGEWSNTSTYNVGDIVHDGSDYWVSRSTNTDVQPSHVTRHQWSHLTTNMHYLGTPASTQAFNEGHVIEEGGNTYLRVGTITADLPSVNAAGWVRLNPITLTSLAATAVTVDVSGFNGALDSADVNVMLALAKLDGAVEANTIPPDDEDKIFLEYRVNDGASGITPGAQQNRQWGTIFQATTSISLRKARFTMDYSVSPLPGFGGGISTPNAWLVRLTRVSANNYQIDSDPGKRIALHIARYPTPASNQALSTIAPIPGNIASRLQVVVPNKFQLEQGEYFAFLVDPSQDINQSGDRIQWAAGVSETSHYAEPDYPHSTIRHVGRAADTSLNLPFGNAWYDDSAGGAHNWEIDYTVHATGISTLLDTGVQAYHGPVLLDFREGLKVVSDLTNGGADISFDVGQLPSFDSINANNEFIVSDPDDDDSAHRITLTNLAKRLADGSTITASGGTLTGAAATGTPYTDADVDARVLNRLENATTRAPTGFDTFLFRDTDNDSDLSRIQAVDLRGYTTVLWARPANTDQIPADKLANAPGGGGGGGTVVAFANDDTASTDSLTVAGTTKNLRGDSTLGTTKLSTDTREIFDADSEIAVTYLTGNPVTRTIRHIRISDVLNHWITHQGDWQARAYEAGAVVRVGIGDTAQFWIASASVAADEGQPTFADPEKWFHLGHRAEHLGDLGTEQSAEYDFYEGTTWLWDGDFYIANETLLDTSTLAASTHAGVVKVTDPFHGKAAQTATPHDADLVLFFDTSADVPVTRTVAQARVDLGGGIQSTTILSLVALTQTAYDALTPVATTLYIIAP